MAVLTNSPTNEVALVLERGQSFCLGLRYIDEQGQPRNIRNAKFKFVLAEENHGPALLTRSAAPLAYRTDEVEFLLQAKDLNLKPGSYRYSVTIKEANYVSLVLKGTVEVQANTSGEHPEEYAEGPIRHLVVVQSKAVVDLGVVRVNPWRADAAVYTETEQEKLATVKAFAEPNVVPDFLAGPEAPGYIANKPDLSVLNDTVPEGCVLVKAGNGLGWRAAEPKTLPAATAGVLHASPSGPFFAPVAESVNGLKGHVTLTLDQIPDGQTRRLNSHLEDLAERVYYKVRERLLAEVGAELADYLLQNATFSEYLDGQVTQKVGDMFTIRFKHGSTLPSGTAAEGSIYFEVKN